MPHPVLLPPGVHPDRVRVLRDDPPSAVGPVVYWMQAAQRVQANPALEHAQAIAATLGRPLAVVFGLTPDYPEATARAYAFMLEGLVGIAADLRARGIGFTVALGSPPAVALAAAHGGRVLVCDRGYLRHQRSWVEQLRLHHRGPLVQVEGEVVVPVDRASPKAEYAARTLRPKLWRLLEHYQDPVPHAMPAPPWEGERPTVAGFPDVTPLLAERALLTRLGADASVAPVSRMFPGGEAAAQARLQRLLTAVLPGYSADRNQPQRDGVSYLGMYLHFGMVSPSALLQLVRRAAAASDAAQQGADAFVEELLVRRELAINHVLRTPDYGRYSSLPAWAQATLALHRTDPRAFVYDDDTLLAARTHDPYWNAAMVEMRDTGYMHNYMRMYWGKKVLEWSPSPEAAYDRLLRWNNRYFLDGRDPNSFAGVGWVFGLHDRPWMERPIFGTIRYMNAAGLRRKADPDAYVRKVQARVAALRHSPPPPAGP
jgi:deoxyribodipyrimidine photo-lyase